MKGVVARHLPGRHARRHHARHSAARRRSPARSSWRRRTATFPPGTIFLVVVDPGVGSARRGDRRRGRRLPVRRRPTTACSTLVLDETPPQRVVELTERRYARPTVSRTFEGRDRFAPAAAWLARGIELDRARPPGADACMRLDVPQPRRRRRRHRRRSAARRSLRQPGHQHRSPRVRRVRPGGRAIVVRSAIAPVAQRRGDVRRGRGRASSCALFGSTDHLEIAVNGGSAAETLGARPRRRRARRVAARDTHLPRVRDRRPIR